MLALGSNQTNPIHPIYLFKESLKVNNLIIILFIAMAAFLLKIHSVYIVLELAQ